MEEEEARLGMAAAWLAGREASHYRLLPALLGRQIIHLRPRPSIHLLISFLGRLVGILVGTDQPGVGLNDVGLRFPR